MAMACVNMLTAQCVSTCSNYAMSTINYSLFSASGPTLNSLFMPTADDGSVSVPIGFNFSYYCGTYSNVNVCTNGFMQFDYGTPLTFGSPPVSDNAQSFPSAIAPNGIVALNMNDFDVTTTGSISYTTVGTAPNRVFILTYDHVPIWYNAATSQPPSPVYNTGQIVLYETTNVIEIHTGTVGLSPNLGTQGIENTSGSDGMMVSGRNNAYWSGANDAYRFTPVFVNVPTPPGAILGNTTICSGVQGNYSIPSSSTATSYSWSAPGNWSGTSNTTVFTPTTGSTGNIQVTATYTCGTSTPRTLFVSVIPPPSISLYISPLIICSGNTITVTPVGGANYTLEPGSIPISSAITLTPDVTTFYTLYGTNAAGCPSYNNPTGQITVNDTPTVTVNSGSICVGQSFTMVPSGADAYTYSSGFPAVAPQTGVYNYSVVGTNATGCVSDTVISNLVVNANPTLTLTANKTIVCKNGTVAITAQGADTYSWTGGPTTAINTITVTATAAYTVTGTSAEGCSKTKAITIIMDACTGMSEITKSTSLLTVYPNPSNGEFTLNTPVAVAVVIYDIQGKVVSRQNLSEGDHTITIPDVKPGQYFLKATSENQSQSVILIKE